MRGFGWVPALRKAAIQGNVVTPAGAAPCIWIPARPPAQPRRLKCQLFSLRDKANVQFLDPENTRDWQGQRETFEKHSSGLAITHQVLTASGQARRFIGPQGLSLLLAIIFWCCSGCARSSFSRLVFNPSPTSSCQSSPPAAADPWPPVLLAQRHRGRPRLRLARPVASSASPPAHWP
jgi:hypothetical protein